MTALVRGGVFNQLSATASAGKVVTLDELAGEAGAEVNLLRRLLRIACPIGFIREIGPDTFTEAPMGHLLTLDSFRDHALVCFDMILLLISRITIFFGRQWMEGPY